jgi:UDP-2,3-diacylglucosamine pyrophosphatase LpxH
MKKRKIDLLVLSDIHLGTYGCHAEELCDYLDSIEPSKIVLNGDIIDIWSFKKSYWPQSHHDVLQRFLGFLSKGVDVVYLTGNHDELLRRFSGFHLGHFHLLDKLVLDIKGRKTWIFHGDVFDMSMQHSRWIAKLGGWGYDLLIRLNRAMNQGLQFLGREPYSLSKAVKNGVKKAVSHMSDFEATVAGIAIEQKYDTVVMGHIHNPVIKTISTEQGSVQYLNSGDWIENLTSLECVQGHWHLYRHKKAALTSPSVLQGTFTMPSLEQTAIPA